MNLTSQANDYTTIPIWKIIKCQSLIRGMLARKKVKSIYGWEVSPNLFARRIQDYIDPVKLEEQRLKVQEIRKQLPPFDYEAYENQENDGVRKIRKEVQTLADNALYEGEWNVQTDMRHGQGY